MMDHLGIKALRPGPSGKETDPNHANYDESTANPYPNLPDALTLKNGKRSPLRKCGGNSAAPKLWRTSIAKCWAACPRMSPKLRGQP